MAVGEQPVMPDALKAWREDVHQEAAEEFSGGERHYALAVMMAVILPAEADGRIILADQTLIGDGDAMRVAAEIFQHLSRTAEGRLGIDYPLALAERTKVVGKGIAFSQLHPIAVKAQFTVIKGLL